MNVVDASGWLEYFADGPDAAFFAQTLQETGHLVVPTTVVLEVFRHVYRHRGESEALQAAAAMQQAKVEPLDTTAALDAARLCVEHGLSPSAGIALAAARKHDAQLWTLASELRNVRGVRYRPRSTGALR